ncbi:hypothetical protein GGI43DRAFT_421012 [Trichoderma evansii]
MNQVSPHMAGSDAGRVSARPTADAENEQPDTSSLPAAKDTLNSSLKTTVDQNPALIQSKLLAPPMLRSQMLPLQILPSQILPSQVLSSQHLSSQVNSTAPLVLTAFINTNHHHHDYNPMYFSKAILKMNGNVAEMASKFTEEEWSNHRRIVQFNRSRYGSVLNVGFKAVPINERLPNSICISCIWWAEKYDCYFTSIDVIHLLEQLVAAPKRFTVQEKNRIRRGIEGFHPVTVSKTKPDNSAFFKRVMAFPHPKPRNIETSFKVFPWAYSAMPFEPSDNSTGSVSPISTSIHNNALRSSIYASIKRPQRNRGLNSDDTQADSSKLLKISPNTLFSIMKDVNADEAARERLLGTLPDLLEAFALKIGYGKPVQVPRDAMFFVNKYRQEATNLQE